MMWWQSYVLRWKYLFEKIVVSHHSSVFGWNIYFGAKPETSPYSVDLTSWYFLLAFKPGLILAFSSRYRSHWSVLNAGCRSWENAPLLYQQTHFRFQLKQVWPNNQPLLQTIKCWKTNTSQIQIQICITFRERGTNDAVTSLNLTTTIKSSETAGKADMT